MCAKANDARSRSGHSRRRRGYRRRPESAVVLATCGKMANGKIENVILSKDGLVRGAKVRVGTKSGERGGCVVLERPLQRLYPLEVRPDREETGPVPGHADRLSHSSGEKAQTGNGKDKRPNSALQLSDTFDEALRVASSHTETQERKSKRAAARDSDFMRNFLQHR